jgi:pimeloyl-ACP methyl ester carboxylesterase
MARHQFVKHQPPTRLARRALLTQAAGGVVLGATGLAATSRGALAQTPSSAPEITHRQIETNGISMHIAEAGSGPLVVLVHGWPELWYSWRHQLPALAAGYHTVAPDMRGFGETDAPEEIESYSLRHQIADVLGLLDALGTEQTTLVGHDIGAGITWACAELYPERIASHITLGIAYTPRSPAPPVQMAREYGKKTNTFQFMVAFQEKAAEAELGADVRGSLRRIFYALSADAPPDLVPYLFTKRRADSGILDGMPDPDSLPAWLSEADLDVYTAAYERTGFRGSFGGYRNFDRDWAELPEVGAKGVRQPSLFVGGTRDSAVIFTGFEALPAMEAAVPNLRKNVLFPRCGHWSQQECPDEVNTELIDFLSREIGP